MRKRIAVAVMVGLAWTAIGSAQTVINPSRVEFDSVNHGVACPADSCVTGYRLELWLPTVDPATGAPVTQAVVPKATVQATGATPAYKIDRASWGVTFPPATTYVLRLVAVGEGTVESARSLPSQNFVRTALAPSVPSAVRVVQ